MFEWNEDKRLRTLSKHGIDFVDAARIFLAPYLVLPGLGEGEARSRAIGGLDGRAICVVFTMRGDTIRIITARAARKDEREKYQDLLRHAGRVGLGPD
jgi:hypothetical protein